MMRSAGETPLEMSTEAPRSRAMVTVLQPHVAGGIHLRHLHARIAEDQRGGRNANAVGAGRQRELHLGIVAGLQGAVAVVGCELHQLVPLALATAPALADQSGVEQLRPGYSGTVKLTVMPGWI